MGDDCCTKIMSGFSSEALLSHSFLKVLIKVLYKTSLSDQVLEIISGSREMNKNGSFMSIGFLWKSEQIEASAWGLF